MTAKYLFKALGRLLNVSRPATTDDPGSSSSTLSSMPGAAAVPSEQPHRRIALEHFHGAEEVPISVRILSAVLLHRSGHWQDAWDAFNALVRDPQLSTSDGGRAGILSEIYARMCACLEQEGRYDAALAPAVLAYAARAQAYAIEGRLALLDQLRTRVEFERQIAPLAERAQLRHQLPALRALLDAHLSSLPRLDIDALRVTVERFARARPTLLPPQPADGPLSP